jgi:two-component system, OmpR family, alkaline phosphatase synthesis response regulator PhoP
MTQTSSVMDMPTGIKPETSANSEIDLSQASILLVDDNLQNLELMQAYLESLPCSIRAAKDGLEAALMIEEEQPDLILLDVMMPRMSGFELCQKLKSNPNTRDIVIIMVTALHEVGDFERAIECGTNDFITKPVNKLELVTRVKSLLELSLLKRRYDQVLALTQRISPDDRNRADAGQKLE